MNIREAVHEDLNDIITLYHDDELGQNRELMQDNALEPYEKAFNEIANDNNNTIFVMEENKQIVGTLQLMIIPHLSRGGSKRAQIESVRIRKDFRGRGLGKKLMQFAIDKAKKSNCKVVQLTTDKSRTNAHQFYLALGFSDNHIGMKLFV